MGTWSMPYQLFHTVEEKPDTRYSSKDNFARMTDHATQVGSKLANAVGPSVSEQTQAQNSLAQTWRAFSPLSLSPLELAV